MNNLFYRVKNEDTLLKISAKFSVPAGVIAADNDLKKEPAEGDILYISQVEGKAYMVKPEDTVYTIAEKFGVSPEEILLKNKIPYVFAGETIII